jgi:hypothetical protein
MQGGACVLNHTKLLDYAYDTDFTDDVADRQTDRQEAITLKTVAQLTGLIPKGTTVRGYADIVLRYYAAVHGMEPEEYLTLLIFKDQADHTETASME